MAAFGNAGISTLTLGNKITSIPQRCFEVCKNLSLDVESFFKNTMITSIGDSAFINSPNITGEYEDLYNSLSQKISVAGMAFAGTGVIRQKILKFDGRTSIGNSEFANRTRIVDGNGRVIEDLVLPDSITSIGPSAFNGCSGLHSVTISNPNCSIGNNAFAGCTALTNVILPNNIVDIPSQFCNNCTSLENITFPDSVKTVGSMAFRNTGITSLDLNKIESIGTQSFHVCSNLKKVDFGDCLTIIGQRAFGSSPLEGHIILPETVTGIGSQAFEYSEITKVTIGTKITELPSTCFRYCEVLEEVTLEGNLTSIGASCFEECTSLNSINAKKGLLSLQSIGDAAFINCLSLDITVTLSDTCVFNRESAFFNCPISILRKSN